MNIVLKSYELTKTFPGDEKFGLVSQINRAAVSVPSNIAEGSSRASNKEYKYYLQIALGSCFELETQVLIAQKLLLSEIKVDGLIELIDEEQKMLMSFIRKL